MKVIAKRKEGLDWLYAIVGIICAILFVLCLKTTNEPFPALLLLVVSIFSIYTFISYKNMPKDIISVDEMTGQIYLHPDDITVFASNLVDISYDKARSRSIQYRWGTLILETGIEKFEYKYVADVENVAKELTRIMYLHKNR